ncbi:invasion associated locus B family protein [Bartonella sp. B35(2025)]
MYNSIVLIQIGISLVLYKLLKKTFFVGTIIYISCNIFTNHAVAQKSDIQNIPNQQTYGAWIKVCSLPLGTPNIQCEAVQNVYIQNRPDINLRITFYKLPKNQGALMRVIVPIQVELRLGVGIKIDGKDMEKIEYRRCLGDNCVAEALLKDDVLKFFLEGKMATYFIFTTPEQGIGGLVDLHGLRDAYDALPQ